MVTDLALLRLMQLVSPGLPIGMYSYSQGLEKAVEDGWVSDESQAGEWIQGLLERSLSKVDVPILARLYRAWQRMELDAVEHWSQKLHAHRETAELRAEERQTGQALARVLTGLGLAEAESWKHRDESSLVTGFALAAVVWHIPLEQAATGYLWSWLENQVLCAVKLIPLGQTAGQRLLITLSSRIPSWIAAALELDDADIGGSSFAQTLASSRHEMQYSRLFRS